MKTTSFGKKHYAGLLVLASAGIGFGVQAQAPAGMVYVESNIGDVQGHNSILAYKRDALGHLAQVGEYLTGGTGAAPFESKLTNFATTLGPLDSDQNVILNPDGTRLFAVNSGSDTIAVFDVRDDGSLRPVEGSPFPSHGVMPVSVGLARHGEFLTVVNKDYDQNRVGYDVTQRQPNYTNFLITPRGRLIHVPFSTVEDARGGPVGPGSLNPSQALVTPGGRLVFDADNFASAIVGLDVRPDGRLVRTDLLPTPTSEYVASPAIANPSGRPYPLGLVAHPTRRIIYAGFVFEGRVAVYTYDLAGRLQFVRTALGDAGTCWIVINKAGNRIYTSNTAANSISVLDTTDPLNPAVLQEFFLPGPPAGTAQIALDGSGQFLQVLSQKGLNLFPVEANNLAVLRLAADGTIAEATDQVVIPVFPSQPQGVAAR